METYEICKNNLEDYRAFIRAIKNIKISFQRPFFDDIQFYNHQPDLDLRYKLKHESDNVNNSDLNLKKEWKINKY